MRLAAALALTLVLTSAAEAASFTFEFSPIETGLFGDAEALGLSSADEGATLDAFLLRDPPAFTKYKGALSYARLPPTLRKTAPYRPVQPLTEESIALLDTFPLRSGPFALFVSAGVQLAEIDRSTGRLKKAKLPPPGDGNVVSGCVSAAPAGGDTVTIAYRTVAVSGSIRTYRSYVRRYDFSSGTFTREIKLPPVFDGKDCRVTALTLPNGSTVVFSAVTDVSQPPYLRPSVHYALLDRAGRVVKAPDTVDLPQPQGIASYKAKALADGFAVFYLTSDGRGGAFLKFQKYDRSGQRVGKQKTVLSLGSRELSADDLQIVAAMPGGLYVVAYTTYSASTLLAVSADGKAISAPEGRGVSTFTSLVPAGRTRLIAVGGYYGLRPDIAWTVSLNPQ